MTSDSYDTRVAIVGDGIAGLATAIALAIRHIGVTLLTSATQRSNLVGEHLPPEAFVSLGTLGIRTAKLAAEHLPSCGITSYWGSNQADFRRYFDSPYGNGINLDRSRFDQTLRRQAIARGVQTIGIARRFNVNRRVTAWQIRCILNTGADMTVNADFLVDATGRHATLARRLGSKTIRHDKLIGLHAIVSVTQFSDNNLLLEATPNGWWYSAQLPGQRCVSAFMTDHDLFTGPAWSAWETALYYAPETSRRLGSNRPDLPVLSVPAMSQILDRPAGPGWLAVGDAAMAFDPISSAGITKAMVDGLAAAGTIDDALNRNIRDDSAGIKRHHVAYGRYQERLLLTYASERRWQSAPFWKRRNSHEYQPLCP